MNRTSTVAVSGPLEPFASGFEARLVEQGYRPSSVVRRLRVVGQLSCWQAAKGVGTAELTSLLLKAFLDEVASTSAYRRRTSRRALQDLMGYLAELGVVPPPEMRVAAGPWEELLGGFADYLVHERGVATATTVRDYQRMARSFLCETIPAEAGLGHLRSGDVTGFVLAQCRGRSSRWAGLLVTALRSLLRFLYLEGITAGDLSAAVPNVARWRGASLPRSVAPEQVRRLLDGCDRRTSAGRRDYAVLMLLLRLGLRAGEVAALQLQDVDWRAGDVAIRGKGDRQERLPLPADVGPALAGYVRRGRPRRQQAHLFLQVRAPYASLTSHAVRAIVARASSRAGLPPVAAHRLRHTAACEMLHAGAPLSEIAGVLRHRSMTTTAIYAKVDQATLGQLARAWPAGAR